MKKITYLLGAGASQKCLPVVKDIPGCLSAFAKDMGKLENKIPEYFKLEQPVKKTAGQIQLEFIDSLEKLAEDAGKHSSIDTLAKKLSIRGHFKDLNILKVCLSIFFIYTQYEKTVDQRYDSFIASLINNPGIRSSGLPDDLRILSWNYDFQFEKAYSYFRDFNSLQECQSALNVFPANISLNENNGFSLYKLNGTTGFYHSNNYQNVIETLNDNVDVSFLGKLLNMYAQLTFDRSGYDSMISFAWENNQMSSNVLKYAMQGTADTKVLVVIGYSFPFFNREVDRQIIGNMKHLDKIYFQAPDKTPYEYIESFKAIKDDLKPEKLIPINNADQFFLPPEL